MDAPQEMDTTNPPADSETLSSASPSPDFGHASTVQKEKSRKRKKKQQSSHKSKITAAPGSKSLFGPGQVRSRTKSSPSFSIGKSERPQQSHPISPGPVFYPKPTLGNAPSYSFSGEYGPRTATLPPAPGSLTKEQMELLEEDAKSTPIPSRFRGPGALLDYPGPGQYRVQSQLGFGRYNSGTVQVLSKNRTGPRYSLATRARPPPAVTVSPGPAAYSTGNTALGRQTNTRYRSHSGFGFGGETRGYEMKAKYNSPGPGAHVV